MYTIPDDGSFELGLIDLISEHGKVNVASFYEMSCNQYGKEVVTNALIDKLRKYHDLVDTQQVMKNIRDQILTYFQLIIFLTGEVYLNKYQYFELDPDGYMLIISNKYQDISLKYNKNFCIEIDSMEDIMALVKDVNFIFMEKYSHILALSIQLNDVELIISPRDMITFFSCNDQSLKNDHIVSSIKIAGIHRY